MIRNIDADGEWSLQVVCTTPSSDWVMLDAFQTVVKICQFVSTVHEASQPPPIPKLG
jgi:hypothetical protein